jgi:hypothetical protein
MMKLEQHLPQEGALRAHSTVFAWDFGADHNKATALVCQVNPDHTITVLDTYEAWAPHARGVKTIKQLTMQHALVGWLFDVHLWFLLNNGQSYAPLQTFPKDKA